jgi:hypothetical protein
MKFSEMTREEANQILDQIRDGSSHSEACALSCLYLTGDLNPHATVRGEGVGHEVSQEGWRGRVRARQGLVGASQGGYKKKTGQSGAGFFGQTDGDRAS